jgi:hypothetical protein
MAVSILGIVDDLVFNPARVQECAHRGSSENSLIEFCIIRLSVQAIKLAIAFGANRERVSFFDGIQSLPFCVGSLPSC